MAFAKAVTSRFPLHACRYCHTRRLVWNASGPSKDAAGQARRMRIGNPRGSTGPVSGTRNSPFANWTCNRPPGHQPVRPCRRAEGGRPSRSLDGHGSRRSKAMHVRMLKRADFLALFLIPILAAHSFAAAPDAPTPSTVRATLQE